ncbi:hypothetical protein [Pontimicrobium sp. MEBiC01747]
MNNAKHCVLCDNKIVDYKTGVICSLTNKKPDFQEKCNVIKLNNTFKSKITETNIEYEAVLKTRTDVYGMFIFYLIIALAIFVGGYLLGKYIFEAGVISTIPLIIMGVGIIPLGMAFGPLNYYKSSLKIASKRKKELDKIARLYGYSYNIKIAHLKDSLGNKSYETDLNLRRIANSKN